jgi:outer membrane lipopolysaccharide assembly protein LptE/RlpB
MGPQTAVRSADGKESEKMLAARIIFAVAAVNLLVLFSELSINVIRAFLG